MRAFQSFRTLSNATPNIVWTESDSLFPYTCSQCRRDLQGKRFLGSTMNMNRMSHNAVAVLCPDCKAGRDPHRKPVPKLAERRTSLD